MLDSCSEHDYDECSGDNDDCANYNSRPYNDDHTGPGNHYNSGSNYHGGPNDHDDGSSYNNYNGT